MGRLLAAILACSIVFAFTQPGFASCLDLSKGEPKELVGRLEYRIFPGAPGFADVAKGDTPEPGFLLTLPESICLNGDDFADPSLIFTEVQVVAGGKLARELKSYSGGTVKIGIRNALAAENGHHHRPLVVWADRAVRIVQTPAPYGSAQAVVEGFYHALETGDGAIAAGFVIPEKNKRGPFSPAELSRYFGSLPERLHLVAVEKKRSGDFLVQYRYRDTKGICEGAARVSTIKRNGRYFINSINALNGC